MVYVLHGQQKCIVKECPNLGRTYKEAYNWLNIFSSKRHGGQGVGSKSLSYRAGITKLGSGDGEGSSQLCVNVWGIYWHPTILQPLSAILISPKPRKFEFLKRSLLYFYYLSLHIRRGEGETVNIYIKAERNRDSRRRVKLRGEN